MTPTDWQTAFMNDARTIEELVECALTEADDDLVGDAICLLHLRATRPVLDAALALSESRIAQERELGADILGQLGCYGQQPHPFFDETVARLIAMLPDEQEVGVLNAIGVGLGHRHDARGVEPLSRLREHPHEDVRYGVVMGLAGQNDPLAIQTLIGLTRDEVTIVRDWATFTLGVLCDLDTPAIREALWQRTDDLDDNTRHEALVGLAQRHDERIVPKLIVELQADTVYSLAIEAARDLGSPQLLDTLRQLERVELGDDFNKLIQNAIASCTKNAAASLPSDF